MQYRPTFSIRSAAKRSSASGLTQTASRNASYGPFSILLIMYQGKLRPLIIYTDIPVIPHALYFILVSWYLFITDNPL